MNVDEWIAGASRTHRSVTLYQRADVLADLDEIDRAIDEAKLAGTDTTDLVEKWTATAKVFTDSALVVRVRGLSGLEVKALRAEALLGRLELDDAGAKVIAAACISPDFTSDQIIALVGALGEPQVAQLSAAVLEATGEIPGVDRG